MKIADASLALKWYLDEAQSDEAERWFAAHAGQIVVPDLFLTEVTGALVRGANIDKSLRPDIEIAIARFVALFDEQLIRIAPASPERTAQAATLALTLGHPLKDCLYLALAIERQCELVTCDARFAEKAKGVWDGLRLLGK